MSWSETIAALKRLHAAWIALQEARRSLRAIERRIEAQRLVDRALELDPDALDPVIGQAVDRTLDAVRRTGWPGARLSHVDILRHMPPAGRA